MPVPTFAELTEPLPEAEVRPVNPAVREAQTKLGTKKGKKGSTADLRIKKQPAASGASASINPGNTTTSGVNKP